MSVLDEHTYEIASKLDAAVDHADEVDRTLRTLTRIELEPGGFLVRMTCTQRLACGYADHVVIRCCGYYALHSTNPRSLIATIDECARQMRQDRDEYQRRKADGELTRL